MNKHLPKIVLIVGIVGLTSSLLYLITIPSKWNINLSELQIVEEIDTKLDRQNSKTIEDTKQIEEKKIMKEINNTDFLDDGKLTILLPNYFFNDDFISLAKEIEEKEKIIIKYQTIDNIEEYKLFLNGGIDQKITADVFLIPSDWLQWLESNIKQIELEKNTGLHAYFHPIFQYVSSQEEYTFVPFSIDPLINIRLLENERESFPHYFQILYNFLYQINLNGNTEILEQFQKIYTNDIEYKRNYIKFKETIKKIEKRNTNCSIFPNVCLFVYKFGDIRFWFMSDLVIWEKYFADSTRKENEVKLLNFPLADDVYKVRWRGFVINENNLNDEQIQKFFQYYLKAWVNNSRNLWWKNISAFTNIYNLQIQQKKYSNIIKYEQKFSILYSSIDLQKDFFKKTSAIKFLKWNISTDEFLKKIKEWSW